MTTNEICEELHQRWSENYQYLWRGVRDSKGRFESVREAQYRGMIYGQNEFIAASQNAEKLKQEIDDD
jgi:hypothetical protein